MGYFAPIGKPSARSILYRLIEAGELARKVLLVPLVERGLEPGDEAVLFLLQGDRAASEADVIAALGLEPGILEPRLVRLRSHNLIDRRAIGPDLTPGLALTDRGERIRELLAGHWSMLEEALLADVNRKDRKVVRRALARMVELLRR